MVVARYLYWPPKGVFSTLEICTNSFDIFWGGIRNTTFLFKKNDIYPKVMDLTDYGLFERGGDYTTFTVGPKFLIK